MHLLCRMWPKTWHLQRFKGPFLIQICGIVLLSLKVTYLQVTGHLLQPRSQCLSLIAFAPYRTWSERSLRGLKRSGVSYEFNSVWSRMPRGSRNNSNAMASTSSDTAKPGFVVGGRYRLVRKIGCHVYQAVTLDSAEPVAVKLDSSSKNRKSQVSYESKLYKTLQGGKGIPTLRWYGQEKKYEVLVMDRLGPSLEDLFKSCSRRFSMKTVLMVADQMISRVEYVHNKNYIHRDIRPENFLVGVGENCNKLYLIDFGIAKKYCDSSKKHMPYKDDKIMQGAALFASINAHFGIEPSRRDDLESLGYVLIYFIRGNLPWHGKPGATRRQTIEKFGERKMSTPVEILCKNLPSEFASYLSYCRGLGFEEDPDYTYLRQLFKTLFGSLNYQNDEIFDWARKSTTTTTTTADLTEESSTPGQKRVADDPEEVGKRKKI